MSSAASAARSARPMTALERFGTFVHALAFVLGLTAIFVLAFGLPTYAVGRLLGDYKPLLALLGGVVVILFAFSTLGWVQIPMLNYDTRKQWAGRRDWGYLSSFFMGVFFAAGWSPCIGTTLGAILTMGYAQETVSQGVFLLTAYSLGLGVPFLVMGIGIDRAARAMRRVQRYMGAVKIVTAMFLLVVGVLILIDAVPNSLRLLFDVQLQLPEWLRLFSLQRISSLALQQGLFYDPGQSLAMASPTVALAFIAGLLSFLSPCVLPLVPAYVGYMSGRAVQAQGG